MMMKIYFTFFLLLFFVLLQAQRRDTITKKDCTEIFRAEKLRFDSLTKDFTTVDFTDLNVKIIKNINKKKFKSQNVIIYLQKQEVGCGSEIDFNNCYSHYNFKNNFYNENNFWDKNSIISLGKYLKLNLIPSIFYFGYTERRDEYFRDKLTKFETLEIKKWNDKGKEYIYFPFNEFPVSINNSDKIYLEFFNYLQKIIEINIYYNEDSEPQTLKFQYINNQWKLIKTKKSNRSHESKYFTTAPLQKVPSQISINTVSKSPPSPSAKTLSS